MLSWVETGAPGVRAPGKHERGFGTTLIDRSLETAGGTARLTYGADGLTCVLDLPLKDEGAGVPVPADGAGPSPPRTSPAQPAGRIRGRRVLVVEDEPLVAMDLEASLEAAGCEVVGPAPSVARALALIAEAELDAAVIDANLGGDPVDAVADALVAHGVPFAFSTGYGREALPARHREKPVLTKPFPPSRLLAVIADLLSRRDA